MKTKSNLLKDVFGNSQSLPRLTEVLANNELQEFLCHAFVCKDHIYASDAHMLVRLNTKEHFTDEFIKQIPETGFLFDRYLCYALHQKNIIDCFLIKIKDSILMNLVYEYGKSIYFPVKTIDQLNNVPIFVKNEGGQEFFERIIPKNEEKKRIPVESIGIKGTFAGKMQKALGDDMGLHLYFFGKDKGIFVEPASFELQAQGRIGILMPMMITEN